MSKKLGSTIALQLCQPSFDGYCIIDRAAIALCLTEIYLQKTQFYAQYCCNSTTHLTQKSILESILIPVLGIVSFLLLTTPLTTCIQFNTKM